MGDTIPWTEDPETGLRPELSPASPPLPLLSGGCSVIGLLLSITTEAKMLPFQKLPSPTQQSSGLASGQAPIGSLAYCLPHPVTLCCGF